MIVVDASIVVKILLDEQDSALAATFLRTRSDELCGPDLLALEVCRAWVAAANAGRIDRARARGAIEHWMRSVADGDIRLHAVDAALMLKAVGLAMEIGHPLPDCIYLALADQFGCPLVTADARFRDRVGDPKRVKLLAEWV